MTALVYVRAFKKRLLRSLGSTENLTILNRSNKSKTLSFLVNFLARAIEKEWAKIA